jgi:hypothetical protein
MVGISGVYKTGWRGALGPALSRLVELAWHGGGSI